MKTIITILFCLLFSNKLFSQAYVPLNIDTSCIWVHDYHWYDGFTNQPFTCDCETTTYVEKDTLINGLQYFKLITYPSANSVSEPKQRIGDCNLKLKKKTTFIREDTFQKKIFRFLYDTLAAELDLHLGDTVHLYPPFTATNPIIDSITIENFNGINRTCKWTHTYMLQPYRIIDEIGPEVNFPICSYGEWGIPAYSLKCYKKNGFTLFPDMPLDSCIKAPFVPVGIDENVFEKLQIIFAGHTINIENPKNEILELVIYDIAGKAIFADKTNEKYYSRQIQSSPSAGIYLLQLRSGRQTLHKKILID